MVSTHIWWIVTQNPSCDHWYFLYHGDVIKWKHFPRNWPFSQRIHRSPVNSPHKGQWRGALRFSLICAWISDWVNNREAGDLRRYRAHCDVIVMVICNTALISPSKWLPAIPPNNSHNFSCVEIINDDLMTSVTSLIKYDLTLPHECPKVAWSLEMSCGWKVSNMASHCGPTLKRLVMVPTLCLLWRHHRVTWIMWSKLWRSFIYQIRQSLLLKKLRVLLRKLPTPLTISD